MRRLLKYIPVFVLWLAGIGLCGHMIIIHDHHAETASLAQEERCPASDQHNHHSGSPIHCHAFNDVASEKAIIFQFVSDIQCNDLILSVTNKDYAIELSMCQLSVPDQRIQYQSAFYQDNFPLRAPPSIG